MAKALAGPRIFRKTASEVATKAEEYIRSLADCYTITLRVNGEECALDSLSEKAAPNSRVDLEITNDTDPADKRIELFNIVAAPGGNGGRLDTNGEVANTLKHYNEMAGKLVQTVADLNRVIQEQNKGQLEMAKAMRKTLKMVSKATKRSAKDRGKLQDAGNMGTVKSALEIIKEAKETLGVDFIREALGFGAEFVGLKTPAGSDTGSSKAVPVDAEKGEDSGKDHTGEGGAPVPP